MLQRRNVEPPSLRLPRPGAPEPRSPGALERWPRGAAGGGQGRSPRSRWHPRQAGRGLRRRAGPRGGPQEREILSGGMNPVSPRVLRATRPSGRTTRWVMLPLLRERRSQPSGGNCSALEERAQARKGPPQMTRPQGPSLGLGPTPASPSHFQKGFHRGRSCRVDANPSIKQGGGDSPAPLGRGINPTQGLHVSHKHTG